MDIVIDVVVVVLIINLTLNYGQNLVSESLYIVVVVVAKHIQLSAPSG